MHIHPDLFHCRQNLLGNLWHHVTYVWRGRNNHNTDMKCFLKLKNGWNVLWSGELVHKTRVSQTAGCLISWLYHLNLLNHCDAKSEHMIDCARFEVFTSVLLRIWVFWDVTLLLGYCFHFFLSEHSAFIFKGWSVLPFNHWRSRHPHMVNYHQIHALVADWQAETESTSIAGVIPVIVV